MKKILALLSIVLLIASCSKGNNSASTDDKNFVTGTAPFYMPKYSSSLNDYIKDQKATFDVGHFKSTPDVIYVEFGVPMSFLYEELITPTINGDVITYSSSHTNSFVFNCKNDTITIKNFDQGNLFSTRYGATLGLIDNEYTAEIVNDEASTYTSGDNVVLDLKAYHLNVVKHQNKAYVPYNFISNLLFMRCLYSPIGYNGDGFYFLDFVNGVFSLYYQNTYYGDSYYQGSNKDKIREEYFVNHVYNNLLFDLDHFYGFRDERFVPFESYLREHHPSILSDLKSSNNTTYEQAVEKIFNFVIGDGHTNAGFAGSTYGEGVFRSTGEESTRKQTMDNNYFALMMQRNQSSIDINEVRYSGNTALISFDGFYCAGVEYNEANIAAYSEDNKDTFAMISTFMKEIKTHNEIENVVFDITVNGGGDTNALTALTGLISNQFDTTMYNVLSEGYSTLRYKVDTNLDGLYDENDGYQDQFNFYILTSNFSFSCANLFPFICKENGIATIIGETSGGGACAVDYYATPDGMPLRISSIQREGYLNDPITHTDNGITPDFEMKRQYFYNDSYINTFINSL